MSFSLPFLFVSATIVSMVSVRMIITLLRSRKILDWPNERSSHTVPTLRGAGLALVGTIVIFYSVLIYYPLNFTGLRSPIFESLLIFLTVVLCCLSWLDDMRGVYPIVRLFFHFGAVFIILSVEPNQRLLFKGLFPAWLDFLVISVIWVWFINLFNFMDGIDGIAGVETVSIGVGLVIIYIIIDQPTLSQAHAIIIAGVGIGFLWWNWHPAKVFLGDVGSVPVGFLLGWLLLDLASNGYWLPAIILPLYYLADTTLTLIFRIKRRERIWEAHNTHFYQQAVKKGLSHSKISTLVAITNLLLIGFASLAIFVEWIGAAGAVIAVFVLLLCLKGKV